MYITEYLKETYTPEELNSLHKQILKDFRNKNSEVYAVLNKINLKIQTGQIFTGSESLSLSDLDMQILSSKHEVEQDCKDKVILSLCDTYSIEELGDLYEKCESMSDVSKEIESLTLKMKEIHNNIFIDVKEFKYSLQDALEYKEILNNNESIGNLNSFR